MRLEFSTARDRANISFHSLVSLLIHLGPALWIKGPVHHAQMNEVEWLSPSPFLEYVIHLEDAIWRHPGHWRREQIHSADGRCHASVSV